MRRAQAERRAEAARPAASAARARLARDVDERRDRQELVIFLVRLGAAVVFVLAAYWLLTMLRERGSRYLPLAGAAVAFATIYAFVVAVDYLTDYFDPLDAGLLLLSLLGVVATLVAFWLLQRYIRRRLPMRRAKRRQCPACGFPVGDDPRCEGCGREVVRPCESCGAPRRLAVPFCRHCGAA
jgi:flagellar biogenesis protein FliO